MPVFVVSKDSPVHYLTSVTNSRLPVFRTDNLKVVACAALDEARKSAGMLFFAYVIMPDHLHMLIGSPKNPSDTLRYRKPLEDEPLLTAHGLEKP